MPIDDPLFSRGDLSHAPLIKPWWRHPALIIALIVILAAILATLTGKAPQSARQPSPAQIEVPIEVNYVDAPPQEAPPSQERSPVSPGP